VRIRNSGNSIAYLKKCVNVETDNQSVWPVRMGYSIEYQTNEINHSWRGVFLYSLFSQNEIYEQNKRIYIFKSNYLDKKLNILMNNGYYYIAKIE
jgi:CMP-N-acetylneuraminic acid synthetase